MSLSIFEAAEEEPGRVALIVDGEEVTFRALAERARRAIDRLPSENPVSLVAEPTLERLAALYGLLAARRAIRLLHPRLPVPAPAPVPVPDGTVLIRTAGSTGNGKWVALSQAALEAAAVASGRRLGWRDDDRWLLALPFAHVGGLGILIRCLVARRTAVVAPVGEAARYGVTLASLVPTQLHRLLDGGAAPERLRVALVGGAAAAPSLVERAVGRGWPVAVTYGLTEAGSQVATAPPDEVRRGGAGCGRPLDGTAVRIVDGAIELRGPTVMDGYWPPVGETPLGADGWLATGDLGELDGAGRLHVRGRRDQVIVTGGEKVHPVEVEQALERCPGIDAACAFAVPDERWGQLVAAALVAPSPPDDAALVDQLAPLAPWQRPRLIAYLPSLPLTAAGKLDRAAVAAAARAALRPLQGGLPGAPRRRY